MPDRPCADRPIWAPVRFRQSASASGSTGAADRGTFSRPACLHADREGLTAYPRFPAEHHNRIRPRTVTAVQIADSPEAVSAIA